MSKLTFKTDAYTHEGETATIETSGDNYMEAWRYGYGIYANLIGVQGSSCHITITTDMGGRSYDGDITFTERYSLVTPTILWSENSDFFISKYGSSRAQTFIDEYTTFYNWHNELASGYICSAAIPNSPVGVNTYDNSLSGYGLCTPNGSGFGSPQSNAFNESGNSNIPYAPDSDGSARLLNRRPYNLFMILQTAHTALSYTFTSIMQEIIDDNYRAVALDSSVNWTVNIDGSGESANVSIMWNNPYKESHDNASILIRVGDSIANPWTEAFFLGTFGYGDQPYTKSWGDLYSEGARTIESIANIKRLLNKVVSSVVANVFLFFRMDYYKDGEDINTAMCYVNINQEGNVVASGIYPGEFDDGSTVTVTHKNTDDIYEDFEDSTDDIDVTNYGVSGLSLMTTSYVMTPSRIKQLGNFLWNADFIHDIRLLNNSPIENVISLKCFPFTIGGGSDTPVVLGNVNTGINGNPIQQNANFTIDVGTFKIPTYYNNWLDYKSVIGIFLPMCGGFHSLDTESFMGKTIGVKYYIDVLTGVSKAVISINGIPVQEFGGQIGFDIPVTAQNRSQTELEQLESINKAVGTAMKGDLADTLVNMSGFVAPRDHFETSGSLSPVVNMMTTHDVFIIIERPIVQYPSNYRHTYGKPCNLTLTLNKLSGFTVCENVDCSSVPCTNEEKELIKNLLESGVYV